MLRSVALCGLALSGALAQFEETDSAGIPPGLSQRCEAGIQAQRRSLAFTQAEGEYHRMHDLMCTTVELVPEFIASEPFQITPCIQGIEFINDACAATNGYVCELDVLERITRREDNAVQVAIVQLGMCLPEACTTDDYDTYVNSREDIILDLIVARYPAVNYTTEVTGEILCQQNSLPANFGAGFQTYVSISGLQPSEDTLFTVSCESGCNPAWSVDVRVPTLITPAEVGNLMAALLNADEDFDQSGCLAKFAVLRGNANQYGRATEALNIFCRQNPTIMLSRDGSMPVPITSVGGERTLNFYGATVPFTPASVAGNGVSAFAPGVTLALASIASAVALAH